jgi:hypothetical protein
MTAFAVEAVAAIQGKRHKAAWLILAHDFKRLTVND